MSPGVGGTGGASSLTAPDGTILHSAVFIADDIVFTKNGSTTIYPWMLSTIPDLLKQYSFHAPEGQQIRVSFFRNKDVQSKSGCVKSPFAGELGTWTNGRDGVESLGCRTKSRSQAMILLQASLIMLRSLAK